MNNIVVLLGSVVTILLAAFILLQDRRSVFWSAFVLVFIPIDYIKRFYFEVPSAVRWLPMFAMVGFGLMVFLLIPHRKASIPRPFSLLFLFTLLLGALSLMANEKASIGAYVMSQRGFIMVFGFMTLCKAVYDLYDKDKMFGFIVIAGMASTAAAIFQRVYYVVLLNYTGDRVTGLFSVDGIFVFFQLFCIFVTLTYWLYGRQILPFMTTNQVLIVLMMSVVVCNDKAAIVFLVLLILFITTQVGFEIIWKSFGKIFAGFAGLGLILVIFNAVYQQGYEGKAHVSDASLSQYIENPDNIRKYIVGGDHMYQKMTPDGQLLRGAAVEFAWKLIVKRPETLWLGMGAGSTQHSNMPGAMGYLEERYPGYTIGRVPLSMFLGELGVIGLLAHLGLLAMIFMWRPADPRADRDDFHLIRKGFVVLMVLYYIYENMYFEPVFALLLAALYYPYRAPAPRPPAEASDASSEEPQQLTQPATI
ncbi:MAG: hypothetical protein NW241_18985 [Bacteroidia bacterium]|nr:hypothetical protein [Bacteroidia bacterium]